MMPVAVHNISVYRNVFSETLEYFSTSFGFSVNDVVTVFKFNLKSFAESTNVFFIVNT